MTHPHLVVETDGPVRTLTLDHPEKRNAQTPSLWAALADEARSVPEDVRVVVLRGAGDAFSAGIDTAMFTPEGVPGEESVAQLAAGGPEAVQRGIAAYQEGFTAWAECPAVVVAQVHGYAIGAGFQLALAADLRVAALDAWFAMRETSLGLGARPRRHRAARPPRRLRPGARDLCDGTPGLGARGAQHRPRRVARARRRSRGGHRPRSSRRCSQRRHPRCERSSRCCGARWTETATGSSPASGRPRRGCSRRCSAVSAPESRPGPG